MHWIYGSLLVLALLAALLLIKRRQRRQRLEAGLNEVYVAISRELPGFSIIGIQDGVVLLAGAAGEQLGASLAAMLQLIHTPGQDLASRRRALDAYLRGARESLNA